MTCPDCGGEMTKTKIQCSDLSGWMYGWLCDCDDDAEYDVVIHDIKDWTAELLIPCGDSG